MLAYALATVATDGLIDEDPVDEADQANFDDPNEDVIEGELTAVAQNPDDAEGMLLLANLLGNSGRLNEAIPWYERVLEIRPDDVAARLDFARALADSGFAADAELQFKRAIELDASSQDAHFYLAELYRAQEPPRIDEAVAAYQRAIEIDPSTFIAQQADQTLRQLGVGTPVASPSPNASPAVAGS